MRKIMYAIIMSLFAVLSSCKNKPDGFKILSLEPQEFNNKAQLTIRAVLEENATELDKKKYLLSMYEDARKYDEFKLHSEPTVIGIYLYESEAKMNSSNSSYCAMLYKSPINSEPEISMSISGSNEGLSKEDIDYYESIKKEMSTNGIDVCDFYFQWQQISKKAWADSKNYGEVWEKTKHKELQATYNISEELAGSAINYGYKFCK